MDDDSELEDLLSNDGCELPEPAPVTSGQQRAKIFLTWIVYFVLVWQYKNYISDNAIEQLLKFVQQILFCVGTFVKQRLDIELLVVLATNIPTTLYSARKLLNVDRDCFEQFVVCPKCTKLYSMHEIVINDGPRTTARMCNHIAFPRSKRPRVCGAQLAKKIFLKDGRAKFYALKTYCFKSIIGSLESLLKRPGLEEDCEKWRRRAISEELYADVYDGNIWKDFRNWQGRKQFLNMPLSFGLMMNVDWFRPFKHRNDFSVGVMYMTLMNLPRNLRFKKENVILVGIIPALAHEPKSMNHFLEPVVRELNILWNGVRVNTHNSPSEAVKIYGALLCCAADIPAARKLCGFLGHSANRGCSHCNKFFPGGFGEKKDYSGFEDRDHWPRRTPEQHRRDALRVKNCTSATASDKLASKLGCRYTILLDLPYYSSIRMCVIDPMHNLFLGTAKRVFAKWIEEDVITKDGLETIQKRIEEMSASSDIGRLPGHIKSNYGGYTAAQWKNFVLLYSMYALQGVLPQQHLHYWQSFVLACRHLCQPCITKTDLMLADAKLLDFLREYERLNGNTAITPNMHLHLHLKECVQDYGSIYGFWLFSFERYNGILGAFPTNGKTVEVQIMRKFMAAGALADLQYSLPKQYEEFFASHCFAQLKSTLDSCQAMESPHLKMASGGPIQGNEPVWADLTSVSLQGSYKLGRFDGDDVNALRAAYCKLYPELTASSLDLAILFKKFSSLVMAGVRFGSTRGTRVCPYSRVMA